MTCERRMKRNCPHSSRRSHVKADPYEFVMYYDV